MLQTFPAGMFQLQVNNRNTRTSCEIYSELTRKKPKTLTLILTVNFGYISHLVLVFLLLTLNM